MTHSPVVVHLPSRLSILLVLIAVAGMALPAAATVTVTGPTDGSAYFPLDMPTGAFDERGLSGFEFFISGTTGQFNSNDQYVVQGEETNETQTIANDIGGAELLGVPFDFSIQHNLAGGRNFTFSLTNTISSQTSVLCWGQNCAPGSIAAETINGFGPISDYNGIQVQVRAQEVADSSATVQILGLTGVSLNLVEPLFNETVTPASPGTIFAFDTGRRGQWFMADNNDLTANEWELFGVVTLDRNDGALSDRNKVRLAVDLVRNPELPFVPEPSTGLLVGLGLAVLAGTRRGA